MIRPITLVLLAALAMSVGWGFRGDYGHEAGAMVPGALLALAIPLAAGRRDWLERAAALAFLGAAGWAFGGQMSYGRIVGYTMAASFGDVAYGFACLFLIGGLWGGIGGGILSLGFSQPRPWLDRIVWPLVLIWLVWQILDWSGASQALMARWRLFDSDWVAALSALAVSLAGYVQGPAHRPVFGLLLFLSAGWLAGFGILTLLFGLHMTPPRSDNWSGCIGLLAALGCWHRRQGAHSALFLVRCGFLAGGIGFAAGDFLQVLGRAQWGPIGGRPELQGLDYWKWMEQGFGLIMGAGLGLAAVRLSKRLPPAPGEAAPPGPYLTPFCLVFLLIVMMWLNLHKNHRNWTSDAVLPAAVLGIAPRWWLLGIGIALSAVMLQAIVLERRGRLAAVPAGSLGRAQLLFLLILWIPLVGDLLRALPALRHAGVFLVHASFWLTAALCTLIVLLAGSEGGVAPADPWAHHDPRWRPGRWSAVGLIVFPVLFVLLLAALAVAVHDQPLPGSHLRFE